LSISIGHRINEAVTHIQTFSFAQISSHRIRLHALGDPPHLFRKIQE